MNTSVIGGAISSVTEVPIAGGTAKFINITLDFSSGYGRNKKTDNPLKISVYDADNYTNYRIADTIIATGELVMDSYEDGDKTIKELIMINSKITKTSALVEINTVNVVGSLIDNIDIKSTASGNNYAKLNVAFNSYHRKNAKWLSVFETTLLNNKQQNEIKYAGRGKKGNLVYVQMGEISLNVWTGNDGIERKKFGLICNKIKLLSGNTNSQTSDQSNQGSVNTKPPGFGGTSIAPTISSQGTF